MNEYSKWSNKELVDNLADEEMLLANSELYVEILRRMAHAGEWVRSPGNFDYTNKDEWAERENAQRDAQLEAIREREARTQQLEIARKGLGIICMTDGIGFAGQTAGEALREIGILENKVSHKTSSETDVI